MREILGLTGPRTEHTRGEQTYNRLFPHSPFDSKIICFLAFLWKLLPLQRRKLTHAKATERTKNLNIYFLLICIYFNI